MGTFIKLLSETVKTTSSDKFFYNIPIVPSKLPLEWVIASEVYDWSKDTFRLAAFVIAFGISPKTPLSNHGLDSLIDTIGSCVKIICTGKQGINLEWLTCSTAPRAKIWGSILRDISVVRRGRMAYCNLRRDQKWKGIDGRTLKERTLSLIGILVELV